MRPAITLLHHVGGVYTAQLHGSDCAALTWGKGFSAGLQRLELIAEDHSYTFKTTEQKFTFNDPRPYGPTQP